jgi:hypothetical protein
LNTFGAGLGALLGGWFLVGNLGFVGALWLAAGLEIFAALLALSLLPQLRGLALARAEPCRAGWRGTLWQPAALVFSGVPVGLS